MKTATLLAQYMEAKKSLDHYKKLEADLRIQLVDRCFGMDNLGTLNTTEGDFAIKAVFKQNIRLDEAEYLDMMDDMSDAEVMCVKMKPTLIVGNYNKVDDTPMLDQCLTITPGMPTLTIQEIDDA